jgi:4-hydroxy-tetrahydrodipicolinate reductase
MSLGLAIVGFGKMGQLVERLAPEFGFEVRGRFTRSDTLQAAGMNRESAKRFDAAIEFTTPEATPDNLRQLAVLGINAVCGTTGWLEELPKVKDDVLRAGTGLVWGPNFSIGANAFFETVARAAALLAAYPEYEAWGWEIHHSAKKDAPSGTLKKLASEMRAAGYLREVPLSANRAGAHPGTHEIGFDSAADTITLRHTARSREGFARGALRAARWIAGKKGVYEFREIYGELG